MRRPKSKQRDQKATRPPAPGTPPGGERHRDETRDGGPRYGGETWEVADERGERRFGHARIDDANPSELAPGEADYDDDRTPAAADPELAAAEQRREIESGGEREGIRRGARPHRVKQRESR
jgi:hypothetical protein